MRMCAYKATTSSLPVRPVVDSFEFDTKKEKTKLSSLNGMGMGGQRFHIPKRFCKYVKNTLFIPGNVCPDAGYLTGSLIDDEVAY